MVFHYHVAFVGCKSIRGKGRNKVAIFIYFSTRSFISFFRLAALSQLKWYSLAILLVFFIGRFLLTFPFVTASIRKECQVHGMTLMHNG